VTLRRIGSQERVIDTSRDSVDEDETSSVVRAATLLHSLTAPGLCPEASQPHNLSSANLKKENQ
jgi:hypothetical protein